MKLLIVRHGDPNYEKDTLTPTGWEEAALVADRLSRLEVKAFYVSPLGRAQDTASVTLKKTCRQAETLPWLREFGPLIQKPGEDFKSCIWDWLPHIWTEEPRFYDAALWHTVPIFAENGVAQTYQWVTQGLDALLERHGYQRQQGYYRAVSPNEDTVVLFCHFGVECVILSHLLGIPPMALWQGTCASPTSVTTLTTEERRPGYACFRMNAFGDISHLYAAGVEPSFSARFCELYTNTHQRHD